MIRSPIVVVRMSALTFSDQQRSGLSLPNRLANDLFAAPRRPPPVTRIRPRQSEISSSNWDYHS